MRSALLVVTAVVLLGGLFWWLKPAPPPVATMPSVAPPAAMAAPAPPVPVPSPQVFELVAKGGQLLTGPAVISVSQDAAVTLRITVDHDDELHLHGYDLKLSLKARQPAELSFVADRSGRFEYELHHAHSALGALEVLPR